MSKVFKACGRTMGHGDSCHMDYLCNACEDRFRNHRELAALREEMATASQVIETQRTALLDNGGVLRKMLTAAEQRNSDLVELLRAVKNSHGVLLMSNPPIDPWLSNRIDERITAAINSTESGASE